MKPNFRDSFSRNWDGQPGQGGWQAFGGTWQVVDGAMQNISDNRGAKLMNGSTSIFTLAVRIAIKQ